MNASKNAGPSASESQVVELANQVVFLANNLATVLQCVELLRQQNDRLERRMAALESLVEEGRAEPSIAPRSLSERGR